MLVNNVGFGVFGVFVDIEWECLDVMLVVDVVVLIYFIWLFVLVMWVCGFGCVF